MTGIDPSLFELFREEVRTHAATLSGGLLGVEADPTDPTGIEPLMRAAHSIKGACRIVNVNAGVRLAHVMEDALVAAQHGSVKLTAADIDQLLRGTDLLATLADLRPDGVAGWDAANGPTVAAMEPVFAAMAKGTPATPAAVPARTPPPAVASAPAAPAPAPTTPATPASAFPPVPPFEMVAIPPNPLPLSATHSMLDLFREELRGGLLLVLDPTAAGAAWKAVRGAARLVKCDPVVRVVDALGGYLASVGDGQPIPGDASDWMRFAVCTLAGAIRTSDDTFPDWVATTSPALKEIAETFAAASIPATAPSAASVPQPAAPAPLARVAQEPTPTAVVGPEPDSAALAVPDAPPASVPAIRPDAAPRVVPPPPSEAVVRVTAQSLNRLMGLAGESLVQARWLPSFSSDLLALKRVHDRLALALDSAAAAPPDQLPALLADARRLAQACRSDLADKAVAFDDHAARNEDLNARLYREVIASRMRPFGDGVHGLPRLVRDMARALGKEARLALEGETTEVDRDILEKLESPLSHLVRNAVDHGLESPAARGAVGKPACGVVRVVARHRAGMLHVTVGDDGNGVNLDKLRRKIADRGLSPPDVVARLTEAELLEFLFLPGFSTASAVTEYSGRGVGLDVVQDTIRKVGGSVRITSQHGLGTVLHLQLPLTLSVIRAVVVEVAGEPYAFPHTRIDRLTRVPRADVRSLEQRQFIGVDGQNVGLVIAAQLLDLPAAAPATDDLAVVLLSDATGTYGLVVDSFRGEQDLVVRPLDPRLGKVPNLSAAAILDDGSPVLIVDAEDLIRSMDQYIQARALAQCETRRAGPTRKKHVLVVDDSITVREVERQLLLHKGYDVTVAVDGVDGWNKVRNDPFDLLVSDVDMPRMTGLQLVAAVRAEPRLRDLPVVIVSYKEREEDRLKGLEVGANCYLTKSAFHDNRFIEAVEDLIGPAE